MRQYSIRTSIIHWVIFLLVVAGLFIGHQLADSKEPALSLFELHFLIGDVILVLVLFRVYFRKKDGEPAPANANPLLNKIAAATHVLLNLSLITVVFSGMATAAISGVLNAIEKKDPALIPDFSKVEALEFHETFIGILVALIVFHVAAALYHQFIVKDNLMRRIMIKRF